MFVERESLESWLERGLSLAAIARRVGRDPTTVGYWVRKYGLESKHAARHRAVGGVDRDQLAGLVAQGADYACMAAEFGVSPGTVRYWITRHALKTKAGEIRRKRESAKAAGRATVESECPTHGVTMFVLEGRGYYRCRACRRQRVVDWRRRTKQRLPAEAGGRCAACGYDRYPGALHFHHINPHEKRFSLGLRGLTRSLMNCAEKLTSVFSRAPVATRRWRLDCGGCR